MCEKCLLLHTDKERRRYQKIRDACILAYGGCCVCCGTNVVKYLQLDHIHNDGASHKQKIFGNARTGSMYVWAYRHKFPNVLQLLCANCHQAKTTCGGCEVGDHCGIIGA
jgi:5-methylcytosine-specific restriction endonuclease McrA